MAKTKKCNVCLHDKRLKLFRKWTFSKDGYRNTCRACMCKQEKDRRVKNPGRQADYARGFRQRNPGIYAITRSFETAKRKGLAFDLDQHKEELNRRILAGVCELTGFPLDLSMPPSRNEKRPNAPSIDRVDSSKGYVMSNVRIVCLAVNLAMNGWGETTVMPIIKAWARKG